MRKESIYEAMQNDIMNAMIIDNMPKERRRLVA